MNELVAVEVILGIASVDTNIAEASSPKPKLKGKGGKKKKEFTKQDGKQLSLGVANKGKKKVMYYTKGKCFHCDEKGHWKRNCPKFIAGKNKGVMRSFLLQICLVHNPMDSWCVDSSCTLANRRKIPVVAVRVFNLCFDSRVLILEDCLYIPNFCRNLISVTYLGKHGYCVILGDNVVIKKDKMLICSSNIVDGLYIITPDKHELYNSELDNNSHVKSLKRKFPFTSDAYLWHLRLGHINSNGIQRLVKDGLLEPIDFNEFLVCESYLEGKMMKRPFNAK